MYKFFILNLVHVVVVFIVFLFCFIPSTVFADISQTDMSATSTVYGFGVRYQTLGTDLSGIITGIDIANIINATYYNEFITPILEECSSSEYSDCVAVTSSDEKSGVGLTVSSGIATYSTNEYTLNHCKYYRLALNFHSVGWGTGQLWFLGTTTDAYPHGLYANGENILSDIYFVLHGVDRSDYSANTPENLCVDPVIIVPGLLGSFEKNGVLLMDPILHVYDDLLATLETNGYVINSTLFTFPYNWRNSNINTAVLLKQKIDEIKRICNCTKVDMVAHSMGGLIARQYIESDDYQDDVDQVIFLATPHLGSPKAYLAWEGGTFPVPSIDDWVIFRILSQEGKHFGFKNAFDYIQNRPITSLKELLPIYDYKKIDGIDEVYPNNYPTNSFLENLNVYKSRLSKVDYLNIVSLSLPTIGSISVKSASSTDSTWAHGEPLDLSRGSALGMFDGDGTVPIISASSTGSNVYFNSSHIKIVRDAEGNVFNQLSGRSFTTLITNLGYIDVKFLFILVRSPVNISVIAPDGKKIGYDSVSEINEISGAFYSGNDTENEFIVIPNPLDGEYRVETTGTGDGEYTVAISSISGDGVVDTEYTGTTLVGDVSKLVLSVDMSSPSPTLAIAPEPPPAIAEIPSVVIPTPVARSGGGSRRPTHRGVMAMVPVTTVNNSTAVNPDTFMITMDIPVEKFISLMTNLPVETINRPPKTPIRKLQNTIGISPTQTASVIDAVEVGSSKSWLVDKIKEGFKKLFYRFKK
ncbi:MAG: hypothetical protein COV01_01100 [Candidatus Taylorbacteria bacterium CG10_big_fil_rev_8_21_14_0_10_41_48]|uniref:DUF676 domain-containing protein n=1 Tax=Candidatus Taylorbacteria bacterium CG10_big_fil_rev_8_21_14_0_10_41_48 TaxID=1975024 RepID=A0A2M8LDB3_9BACT|nr:MAG: hypothetical protein COV01_01100 [Candidatus Taylorbacteria bacterium CG10_big_fil_rev_8_21_14_0_10_41_48]